MRATHALQLESHHQMQRTPLYELRMSHTNPSLNAAAHASCARERTRSDFVHKKSSDVARKFRLKPEELEFKPLAALISVAFSSFCAERSREP